MHVRAHVTSMTIEGSGAFGGMNVAIDGDGTSSSDLYYSAGDGILKAVALDLQQNLRMVVESQGDMVVPIAQHVTGTVVRK
jgi:nitrous oxidase accessory protein NosD